MLLFSLLVNLVDVGIVMLTVSQFVEYRKPNRRIYLIIFWIISTFINSFMQLNFNKTHAIVISSIIIFCIMFFCFKKIRWYFSIPILLWALEMAIELGIISLIYTVTQAQSFNIVLSNTRVIYFSAFLSRTILIGACFLLLIFKKKYYLLSRQVTVFQFILLLTGMMLLYSLFDTYNDIIVNETLPSPTRILITIAILMMFLILVFILFYRMQIDAKKDKEFALKEQYEIMSQDAVKQLSDMMGKILDLRHNLRQQLNVMYYLKETGESESALQFCNEIEQVIHEHEKLVILTDKPMIASVLLYFQNLSKTNNFKFTCQVPEKLTVNIPLNDLSGILMNILDNAKNAVMQLPEGRYIDFTMRENKNALRIVCRNPYTGPKKDIQSIKTTDRHGRGLKNVQTTAAHYDGFVEIKNENNIFEIQIDMFGKI